MRHRHISLAAVLTFVLTSAIVTPARQIMITSGTVSAGMPPDLNAAPIARGTGLIIGRVVEGPGNRPIAGAVVTLTLPGSAPLRVMADTQGQFAFRDLPTGRFNISATRAGYADGAFGRVRPGGPAQSLDLAADQRLGDVTIPLWKFAAITGRVVDENGEPIVGTIVRVLKRTIVAGKRQFVLGDTDLTDDRGVYRIGAIDPGEYLVVVPMTQTPPADQLIRSMGLPVPNLPAGAAVFATRAVGFSGNVGGGGAPQVITFGGDSATSSAGVAEDGHPLTYQTEFYPGSLTSTRATPVTVAPGD